MKSLWLGALFVGLISVNLPTEANAETLPQWRIGVGRDMDQSRTTLGAVLPLASSGQPSPALALPAGCLKANGITRLTYVDTKDVPAFKAALSKVARETGVFIIHCKGEQATRFPPFLEMSTDGKSWKVWDTASDNERSAVMWEIWGAQLKDHRTYRIDPGNETRTPRLYDKESGKLRVGAGVRRGELILVLNFDMPQGREAARALAQKKGLTVENVASADWTNAVAITVGPAHAAALFKSMAEANLLIPELWLAGLNAEADVLMQKMSGPAKR